MKLLEYIQLNKSKIFKSQSLTMHDKLRQFCDSLAAFPLAAEADLKLIQTSDFVLRYGRFIHLEYEKKYAPTICDDCVRRLRTVLRYAISHSILPNYDPIPAALRSLRAKVWNLPPVQQETKQLSLGLAEEIDRLARDITWTFSKRNATPEPADSAEARRLRDQITETRAAAIYLFGILCLGLDVQSVITLPQPEGGKVYVEKYRRHITLPPATLELVRMHNHGKVCTSSAMLFKSVASTDTPEQIAARAANIERKAIARIKRLGLGLGSMHTLDICITVAAEAGYATPEQTESVIKAYAAGTLHSLNDDVLSTMLLGEALPLKSLHQNWYALCSYSPRLRGSQMRDFISRSGILGTQDYALTCLYDPFDNTDTPHSQASKAISRFLFFRSTPFEAGFVDRLHADASVLRRRDDKIFVVIPRVEIEFMQEHLRDFRDDVELIDRAEWIRQHEMEFTRQSKVIIHEGPFKGYTATIVDIKKRGDNQTFYILELPHDQYTIKATRQALSLDPSR